MTIVANPFYFQSIRLRPPKWSPSRKRAQSPRLTIPRYGVVTSPRERVDLGRGMQWPLPGVSTEGLKSIRAGLALGTLEALGRGPWLARHNALASMLGRCPAPDRPIA